jgi:chloramphenicol 3-O phosphotransferase
MSRGGTNVVVDVGHHDDYSEPLGILPDAARRLAGLPALLVGVRCPIEIIMQRRDASLSTGRYLAAAADGAVPAPVRRWQAEVHRPGIYDLEIDTGSSSPQECAGVILEELDRGIDSVALAALARPGEGE